MCKKTLVILVDMVVDPKRIIRKKMEGQGGGEAQWDADPKKCKTQGLKIVLRSFLSRQGNIIAMLLFFMAYLI
jgi:hypothetical protein